MDILRKEKGLKVALHSFLGEEVMLQEAVELGYFFSEGLAFLSSHVIQNREKFFKMLKKMPTDRLLLETDRFPKSAHGERPPWMIKEVAEQIAQVWGTTADEIGRLTTNNLRRLLAI